MEKIRQFDLLESYNEAYDSLRVNTVSRTEDNKKVHFKPRNQITAYYNVTNTSSAIRILGDDFDTSQIRYMVVDGVKVYPTYYDETEEQVIEAYNMEEQSYATMSLNLDDDDMDYRQHIASPNEGYGEIMTTMALNNNVETYDVNITPTPDYDSRKNSLGYSENEEVIDQIGVFGKYEAKYTSYIDTTYKFDSVGEHVIEFVFKASHNEINHMFNRVNSCIKVNLNRLNGKYMYYNGGMVQTFDNNTTITEIIGLDTLDVSNVFSLVGCFQACHSLKELPISNWDVRNVERMSWCFNERKMTTPLDLSGWNTENCKQMVGLFANGENYEIIFPDNFGSACETFQQMFYFSKIKTISNGFFNTSCAKNLSQMFRNCPNLEYVNLSTFDTTNVFDMSYMFYETGKINNESFLNLNWNTEKLETAYRMFYHCYALSSLDLNSFYTPKLNNCQQMFFGNWSLLDLKIDNLNTDNCNSYYEMFAGTHVTNLNLSSFNSSNVTNMDGMFRQGPCPLDLRNFDLTKVTSMYHTFQNMGGDKLVITSALNQNLNAYGAFDNDSGIIKTFYSNPQHDYSVLTNEMSSNWRYKYIPTEVTFLVKLLNNEDLSLITNKTLFLKQDIIVENQETKEDIITNTNIITSTYDEELGGYPFTFVAYNNQYSIYEEGSETPIGEVMTYNDESILIYGDINNVSYDIIATYKLSTSGSTTLFNASFSKDNLMVMVVDDVQIPLKSNKYTFEDTNEHIVKIKFKEKPTAYDLQYMFNGCSAMTSCDLSNLDTSEVTSMYGMFQGCTSLSSVTFGSNDTTNITNIGNMFYNCSSLTSLDLTMFNNIVNINTLCYGCSKLTELKFNCDFSKVESYGNLLGNVTTNGVLYYNNSYESDNILYSLPSTWTFNPAQIINVSIELVENGSTVTNGSLHTITVADNVGVFNTETNLYDFNISVNSYNSASIKVDGVEQLNFVLVKGKTYKVFLGDTSSYDGFSIEMVYVPTTTTGPTQLFNSSFDLSQIYTMFIDGVMQTSVVSAYTFSDTNEHKVQCMTHDMTSMYYMFYNSKQLKSVKFGDSFNTINVYTMYRTFRNCSNITEIDLSKLNLTNVENMNDLFHSCSNLKKVVLPENFGVNCVEMSYMFNYCYALDDLNYENLNMSNCNTAYYMFCGTPFETFNASIFDMTNMIVCEGMFSQMEKLKSIDISGWNVKNGNSCGAILSNCTSLETVIMDNAYINARNLYAMFGNCTSLKEIDFNNSLGFYGDDFASFFYGCTNLKTIKGIDKLHPKAYTNYVFQNCESLTSIDLSSWDMSNVLRINDMFSNCKKLIDVTIYSSLDSVSDYVNMFSGVTTDGVLNYNIIHEEKILDMFVTNQKVSNFPTSWRLNHVTLEKTYVLTLITNDAYVKNATVSLNNVVGVYNESDYTYTFENVQVTSRQLPLIVDGIEVSQVDESKLVQYVYYGTNDELYTLIDFTTPTFDTSVIIENDANHPWSYNEELGFLTSTMHEHGGVTYITIDSGIIGDVTITLYQQNESESNYDFGAIFNSSDEIIYNLHGVNNNNIVINVNINDGILKFGYQKDSSINNGSDCLGIKKIEGTKLPEK